MACSAGSGSERSAAQPTPIWRCGSSPDSHDTTTAMSSGSAARSTVDQPGGLGQPRRRGADVGRRRRRPRRAARHPAQQFGEEPVEHAHAELQRVDRHPLVDAVEQRHEVEVGRQPQRREPEAADAQRARTTSRRCRRSSGTGPGRRRRPRPCSAAHIASTSAPSKDGLDGDVAHLELALDALAEQLVDRLEQLVLLAGQEARVDRRARRATG